MTSTQLIQWMEHPETLDKESLYELRMLITRYPYFHSLRLLYLQNLYLLHDVTFGDELRKSALFVADRSVLFYQIEGARYALQPTQPLPSVQDAAEAEDGKDRTLFLIDSFLSSVPDEQLPATDLDYSMDYTAFLMKETSPSAAVEDPEESDDVTPPLRGQNLIDDFLNKADFSMEKTVEESDNLSDTSEPVEASSTPEVAEITAMDEKNEAVEVTEEIESVAMEIPAEDEMFTETLAKIYIKQHRYDKALEIIKKLSLNYPKKNAYFADQIRFLEKLIINAKSK